MNEPRDSRNKEEEGELFFSSLYTPEQARRYFYKHQESFGRRLSDRVEKRMVRKALRLAGEPDSVLDLPCGTGRFWPLLLERGERRVLAGDYSGGMLDIACRFQPPEWLKKVQLLQTSAFRIALAPDAVDSILCIRLFHHIGERKDRLRILREFHRVTRDTVCLSLWLDDSRQGRRRRRLEQERAQGVRAYRRGYQDRFVQSPEVVEAEFEEAGFEILDRVRMLPGWSIWSTYVLKKR